MSKRRNRKKKILLKYNIWATHKKSDDEFVEWILASEDGEDDLRDEFLQKLWEEDITELSRDKKRELFVGVLDRIESEEETKSIENEKGQKSSRSREKQTVEIEETPTEKRSPINRRLLRVAAVFVPLLLIVGAAAYLYNSKSDVRSDAKADNYIAEAVVKIETAIAETTSAILSEGSKVWLNSKSQLKFNDGESVRVADLVGEAYFEIAPNLEREFVVRTDELTLTVLGTKFNVKSYEETNHIVVKLDEGSVRVTTPMGEEYDMEPNDYLRYDKLSGEVELESLDREVVARYDWRENRLYCYKMTVEELLQTIERALGYSIKVEEGAQFSSREYVIEFPADVSIEEIMAMIQYHEEELNYTIEEGVVRIGVD